MKRVGIMGGTFNPIHKGHLALARTAQDRYLLDEIVFIPSGTPPHKVNKDILDKDLRYEMVKRAIRRIPHYHISRIELDRPGFSYAVDTFKALKTKCKRCKFFYIMGMDSINEILDWKKPLDLFKLCEFIVGTRPGTRLRTFRRLLKFPPLEKEVDKIHLMELEEDISSSDIRKKLADGRSVKALLPPAVMNFIEKKGLYK